MTRLPRSFATTMRRHATQALAMLAFVTGITGGVGLYVGIDGYYVRATAVSLPAPPLPSGPVCGPPHSSSGTPALCVSQNLGDTTTVFTVRDSGFKAGAKLRLQLIRYAPTLAPTTVALTESADGSFHLGPLPTGLYQIMQSNAGAAAPKAAFEVYPAGLVPAGP
jgi:hypothetical protein